jgi:hypothetical protein
VALPDKEINDLTTFNFINKLKALFKKSFEYTLNSIPITGTESNNPVIGDLEINSKNNAEKSLILSKKGQVGITNNPRFSLGRIVNGGINEPKLRIVFSDDVAYANETTCWEVEPSGTMASVKQVIGSHIEGFLEQEQKPLFRIASFIKNGNTSTRFEFGSGGNNETDIFLERWASWAFALVMGGSAKVIFYPDSIVRQSGVVDAFQQTSTSQTVTPPTSDVKKMYFREGIGMVELGNDGLEKLMSVPKPPSNGNFSLKSIDGVIQWA